MRAILDMDTVQIELTNACVNKCSNCTRLVGHSTPYFITTEYFINALDSMKGFPKMIGFMGGEPLLHPAFEEFCSLALERFDRSQLGLWTCFPEGLERYNKVIVKTFKHVFVNDHSRQDIYHAPILVGIEDYVKEPKEMFYYINHCWLQNSWSASINPNGAFFCEVAAAMSLAFRDIEDKKAWPIEPGWWWRTPKDFKEQIETYCSRCGMSLSFSRRLSTDGRDDISEKNLERLRRTSPKIKERQYVVGETCITNNPEPMAAYKDTEWRNQVAQRYGIYFTINDQRFWEPHLIEGSNYTRAKKSIFDTLKENYNAASIGPDEGYV